MRGGEAGRERGLPGKRLETTKGRWRSFLHMWACASVSNQSGGEKKRYTTSSGGEREKGGREGESNMLMHVRGSPYTAVWRPRSSS